jgi:YVTN family beta-propeller protein
VIATIKVGGSPTGAVFDPANGDIYVTNAGVGLARGTVSVISGATNKVIATLDVGVDPETPAFDPVNGNIYVSNYQEDTVSIISGASNKVIATVKVGNFPATPAIDSVKGNVYVSNQFIGHPNGTVSVISGASNKVIATVTVGNFPVTAAFDPLNGRVYVPNWGDWTVSVIDPLLVSPNSLQGSNGSSGFDAMTFYVVIGVATAFVITTAILALSRMRRSSSTSPSD